MSKASRRQYPVVLRFQSLFPDQIKRYVLHEERKGRGSKHCDPKQRSRNRLNLLGDEDWQERFGLELATASDENFSEEMDALKASNRHKDYLARGREGRKDPWRKSKGGPLREVILTVNAQWFEETDDQSLDKNFIEEFKREDQFVDHGINWLNDRFGGAVITARADFDETAVHIHALIAPWAERTSKRRGRQKLLVPNSMPLLASYELAQDDVGEFFSAIGLVRGEARAKARRDAEAAGEEKPKARQHTPPHVWRQDEEHRLREECNALTKRETSISAREVSNAREVETLRVREESVDIREKDIASRQADMSASEALLDAAVAGEAIPDEVSGEPERTSRLRKKIHQAFKITRANALAEAAHSVAKQVAAAKALAEAAKTFKTALVDGIPKGIRDGILRRVAPEMARMDLEDTRLQDALSPVEQKGPDPDTLGE